LSLPPHAPTSARLPYTTLFRSLAGALKGRRLVTPGGSATRPTSDRVRIACLDTLMPWLGSGAFLDVFAGAGAVGIEALSRGAPSDRKSTRLNSSHQIISYAVFW